MHPVYGLSINEFIESALKEDVGDGDHTSLACISSDAVGKGIVRAKQDGIVAGIVLADQVFIHVDNTLVVDTLVNDSAIVKKGQELIRIEGKVQSILTAERLVLNCMQRMSGIATKTNHFVQLIKGTKAKIMDTRKTTPNCRFYEKWAVQLGGGVNHRFGLYDMILIKDNHVDASGGIEPAITRANNYLHQGKKDLEIEIETRSFTEIEQVLQTGKVQRIILDNFSIEDLRKAVKMINGKFITEASGGVNENNIRQIAETGVDYISVGALTHSFNSLDISLKLSAA